MLHALVIDDDLQVTQIVSPLLEDYDFAVSAVTSLQSAKVELAKVAPDLLLINLMLSDGSGLELIEHLPDASDTRVLLLSDDANVDSAIGSLKDRVAGFLVKPVDEEELRRLLDRLFHQKSEAVPARPAPPECRLGALVGGSGPMRRVYNLIEKVAPSDASVLILGESGTGKELVARTVHDLSSRVRQPFLGVNCGAVSPSLIGSELFGHEKGSFTGAGRQHQGFFERADGGTLFLDEITEMPLELQVQLLRVLETGTITRVGGSEEIPVDVRVLAATNRKPEDAIAEGKLREDLYFRLAVFPLPLPPLRQRSDDIPLLTGHLLDALNREHGEEKSLTRETLRFLSSSSWPGNVRELGNALHRAYILAGDQLLPEHFEAIAEPVVERCGDEVVFSVGTPIEEAERELILATLDHFDGDKPRTAEALGISLKTLYNRLNQYKTDGSRLAD